MPCRASHARDNGTRSVTFTPADELTAEERTRHEGYLKLALDLLDVHFDLKDTKPKEIEESLEDPFAVRLLPDADRADGEARYYALGRTVSDRYLFLCFWTDGKKAKMIAVRDLTESEIRFYDRRYAEFK